MVPARRESTGTQATGRGSSGSLLDKPAAIVGAAGTGVSRKVHSLLGQPKARLCLDQPSLRDCELESRLELLHGESPFVLDPTPPVLGRNGTYVVFRKLHTKVAAYRQYLHARAVSRAEEALLGAKMVGRWPSGAPLALAPTADDPALGQDARRHNNFGYADDPRGLKCPVGAHARRANPRDAFDNDGSVNVRLHRMIRRGTSYGPPLPDDALDDDGLDRGIVFVFAGAHLKRQFEFVKTHWLNDGIFIGAPAEKDPLVGPNDGTGSFTIPQRPIRRRLPDLPPFVVTRGGEYCFAPGLRAMSWLADLQT